MIDTETSWFMVRASDITPPKKKKSRKGLISPRLLVWVHMRYHPINHQSAGVNASSCGAKPCLMWESVLKHSNTLEISRVPIPKLFAAILIMECAQQTNFSVRSSLILHTWSYMYLIQKRSSKQTEIDYVFNWLPRALIHVSLVTVFSPFPDLRCWNT